MIRRLSWIALSVLGLASLAQAVTKNKAFPEYTFNKGVDTYHAPTSLPQGYVQNSLNVLFDDVAPATKRGGYAVAWSTKSYSYTGLWTYTDGTNTTWEIVRSSDQLTANNLAGTVVKIATVSVNNIVGETNAFGNAYFVDQSQGVYYWNGSSTSYIASSPFGSIITSFHGRLWVTGAAVPNGNQLYGSQYFNGTNWTTGLNVTDPVQYSVGLQDNFDNLTAEYVYIDTLYLFKHSSIYALYGFDQSNFQISQLTQECGCIDGGTIQTYNSALEFVSLRGVESFNGYSCKRISDPIKNKIDPAIQAGGFSQQSWVQQSQPDWQAGTLNGVSATVSPPTLVLSTFSVTEQSNTTGWQSGTFTNFAVGTSSLSILTNNSGTATNPDFESSFTGNWFSSGNGSDALSQQTSGTSANCGTVNAQSGSGYIRASGSGIFGALYIIDLSSNVVTNSPALQGNNQCAWTQVTLSASNYIGKRVKFQFCTGTSLISGCNSYLTTSDSYVWGGSATFYQNTACSGGSSGGSCLGSGFVFFDNIQNGSSTISMGSFTSQVYNTGVSSAVYQVQAAWTVNTSTPSFDVQTASNPSTGPWTEITTSTGSNAVGSQYAKYTSTITIGSLDNALSSINSVSLIATASPGTFKSQIHNTGGMNSFGNFSIVDSLNNGNIAFSICSSTNSNMGFPVSCSAISPNSQISIATGTFVQWYSTFTVTAATQTPTLQSATVQWFSGTKPIPMSSTIWDNRYWLSLTTNTADTGNDAVMVLNQTGAWAIFDIHAGAFTQAKNNLYHADSLASGNVYLDNQGFADNGQPINTFINTRNESLGDLASDDYMYALYPTAMATGNCPMTVQYSVDNSTTSYSLGSPLLSEFNTISSVRLPFPIDAAHQDFGQSVDFTLGTNDSQCGWQFLGIEGLYKSRPVQ